VASAAEAQYGLYGAPEILQVSQQTPLAPAPAATALPDPSQSAPWSGNSGPQMQREAVSTPAPQNYDYVNGRAGGYLNNGGCANNGCANPGCAVPDGCNADLNCCQCGCSWYASLTALIMGRSDGRGIWTSYKDGDLTNQLTNTQFNMQWQCGGEIQFGRCFCCNGTPYAVEASFWTGEDFYGTVDTTVPGGHVSSPLDFTSLSFPGARSIAPTDDAGYWFDGAQEHRLVRRDEYDDVEINLIRQPLAWACDSAWDVGWSAGVRYFRFQDFLQFSSLSWMATDWNDAANVGYISDRITNNLIGLQCGFDLGYRVCRNVRLFLDPQVGVYDNYMDATFAAYTGAGVNAQGPYGNYPVHSTCNGLAFLTQIDAGVDWQFARNWSARAGYRVVAVTGVGLADDQFPQYICDSLALRDVQHYSSVVLQGAFVGITYNF
jgi:hypothetical protein